MKIDEHLYTVDPATNLIHDNMNMMVGWSCPTCEYNTLEDVDPTVASINLVLSKRDEHEQKFARGHISV